MPERPASPSQAALEAAEELDLEAQVDALLDEVDQAIARVLQRRDPNFGFEPEVTDLATEAASFVSGDERPAELPVVEGEAEVAVEVAVEEAVEAGGAEEEDLATSLMNVRDESPAPPPSGPPARSVPPVQAVPLVADEPPVAEVPGPMVVAGGDGGAGVGSEEGDLGAGIDQLLDDLDGDMRTAGEIRASAKAAPAVAPSGAAEEPEAPEAVGGGVGGDAVDRELEGLMADPGVAAATRRPAGAIDRDLSQFRDDETTVSNLGEDGGAIEGSYESVEAVEGVRAGGSGGASSGQGAVTARPVGRVKRTDPLNTDRTWGERAASWAGLLWAGLRWAGRCLAVGLTRLEPIAARGVELSAAPLAKQPAVVRSAVGWVGLYTLFLAAVVWAWVLVFREAKTPAAPGPAVTLMEKPAE